MLGESHVSVPKITSGWCSWIKLKSSALLASTLWKLLTNDFNGIGLAFISAGGGSSPSYALFSLFFYFVAVPFLFITLSFGRSCLLASLSVGVRSGVIKTLAKRLDGSAFRRFVQFLRMNILDSKVSTVIFSSLGLLAFFPNLIALTILAFTPRNLKISVTCLISSALRASPSLALDSTRLWIIRLIKSCLLSLSFFVKCWGNCACYKCRWLRNIIIMWVEHFMAFG